jgi:flagellar M-ring protein FliF
MAALSTLSRLPARSKAVLGLTVLGVVLVAFFMLRLAGAPSYSTLVSGLDPAQTGKITAALDEQAIAYEIQNGGTALAVAKADTAKARIALAGQGIAATGGATAPGYELFDEQKLGASDFQQRMTFQRALEGEIGKQLAGVQGVAGAQVRLVLPEDDLFADEASPATAAVSLANPGDTLEPGAVRGMAQMVASSVKGLKPASVTITDSTGQLLWPSGDAAGGAGGGGSTKQSAEERYARSVEAGINAMLTRTLGPNKAMVSVRAQLDMDKTTRNELRYAKKGIPLTTQTETERLRGGGGRAGGAAGTAGNIPSYAGGAGGGGAGSNYQRESEKTENALDKTVSKVEVAPGAVDRLNVSLMLDRSVTAAAAKGTGGSGAQAIEDSVAAAAGLDTKRGDTITTTELAFAKAPAPPGAGPVPSTLVGPLKWAGLGLAALVFCFFMLRQLRRREREALPEPAWLSQIDGPMPLAALGAGGLDQPTRVMPPLPERQVDPSLHHLEQLVDTEPDRVVAQVRHWMNEN